VNSDHRLMEAAKCTNLSRSCAPREKVVEFVRDFAARSPQLNWGEV
jgi:hypothetical protein